MYKSEELIGKSIDGNVIIDYAIDTLADGVVFIVRTPDGEYKTLGVSRWKLDEEVVNQCKDNNDDSTKIQILIMNASGYPELSLAMYNTIGNVELDIVIQDVTAASISTNDSNTSRPDIYMLDRADLENWNKIFNEAPIRGEANE
jgi:hypothetical protein